MSCWGVSASVHQEILFSYKLCSYIDDTVEFNAGQYDDIYHVWGVNVPSNMQKFTVKVRM